MPSLKLSETNRKVYGGQKGKQLLLDSLNFLFAIKGKEFQKLNPSFLPPDATEFIAYSHIINRNLIGKRKLATNKSLEQFLKFICSDSLSEPAVLRCIQVVILALGAYSITEYILMGREDVSRAYVVAFEWYTSQVLSSIQTNHSTIVGTIGRFVEEKYVSQLPTIIKNFASTEDVSAVAIGSYVIHELQDRSDTCVYDYMVQMPFAAMLYKKGYLTLTSIFQHIPPSCQ